MPLAGDIMDRDHDTSTLQKLWELWEEGHIDSQPLEKCFDPPVLHTSIRALFHFFIPPSPEVHIWILSNKWFKEISLAYAITFLQISPTYPLSSDMP